MAQQQPSFDPSKPFTMFDPAQPFEVVEEPKPVDPTGGRSVISRAVGGVLTGSGLAALPGFIGTALTQNPYTTAKDLVKGVVSPLGRLANVGDAYRAGGLTGAANEVAASIPLLGPGAEQASQRLKSGDVAGGIGEIVGMVGGAVSPGVVKPAVGLAGRMAPNVGAALERVAQAKIADVIAPKGVSKVNRIVGKKAAEVAPRLASEPGMGALTRQGFHEKAKAKLEESKLDLDNANDARNPADLVDTSLVTSGLEEQLRKLVAAPAEGVEANAKARAWALPVLPEKTPIAKKFSELPVEYQAEMKRLAAEMEEFQFIDRTWLDKSQDVAREGGYGSGRGSRARQHTTAAQMDKPFVEGEGGTPVYQEIMGGVKGSSRNAVIRALNQYINKGDALPTSVVQRAINLADKRVRTPDAVSKPQLPIEGFFEMPSGKLGESIIPEPSRPRANAIIQALKEVRALGPAAPYESLRKIRQAWDEPANAVYNALSPDFVNSKLAAKGAADVTGTLREVLSFADENTAKANKNYSFWKKTNDVLDYTEELERVRPKVGRRIAARFAGGAAGGAYGGLKGMALGAILGPVIESSLSAGQGFKILLARGMDDLARALKNNDVEQSVHTLKRLRALAVSATAASQAQQGRP